MNKLLRIFGKQYVVVVEVRQYLSKEDVIDSVVMLNEKTASVIAELVKSDPLFREERSRFECLVIPVIKSIRRMTLECDANGAMQNVLTLRECKNWADKFIGFFVADK